MQNELRPCTYLFMGKKDFGLFHCFAVIKTRIGHYPKEIGETVALVENRYGRILDVNTNDICFLDTEKQMSKFFKFKESEGQDNAE